MGAPLSGKSLGNFEGSTGNATSEFCVINSDSGRRIGDRMTFRESARDTDPGATAVAPGGLITADEPETPGALGEEAEETPRPEPLEAGASPRGEDPVRLYLKEIGKVPLLTAAQEVQIGRRIEVGQIALRRTLAGIPMAVEALLEVGDKLRRGEIPADDVIVLAEGGELDANELRPVLLAFGRLRRLQRKIAQLQDKRRSKAGRVARAKAIAVARETIQKIVADMPLKPALIDDLVDPPGHHAGDRRSLAHDPDSRPHGRDAQPDLTGEPRPRQRDGPRGHAGGAGPADRRAGEEGTAHSRVVAEAAVPRDTDRRGLRARRLSRGQVRRLAQRVAPQPGPDDAGRAGAVHAFAQGEGDPAPPVRHRRGGRAHARGGRPALRGHARAHPSDRGQGAAEAAPPAARPQPPRLRRELTARSGRVPLLDLAVVPIAPPPGYCCPVFIRR